MADISDKTTLYRQLYEAVKTYHNQKSQADQQRITNEIWKTAKENNHSFAQCVSASINDLKAKAIQSASKSDIRCFFSKGANQPLRSTDARN